MNYDYAVVIGRFQLPHKAHFNLIQRALESATNVIICIGSANVRRNLRNPFSVTERMSLLQYGSKAILEAVSSGRLKFVGIEDSYNSDQHWVECVQRAVERTKAAFKPADGNKTCLVGFKKDETSNYLDMFPQWDFVPIESVQIMSSTECRESYFRYGAKNKSVHNILASYTTEGVIEALSYIPTQVYESLKKRYEFVEQYRKEWGEGPHYTADAVVIKSGHVLLVERGQEPDVGSLAFPGGFVGEKESSLIAAKRELKEETGLVIGSRPMPRNSRVYNDKNRDDRGHVVTSAWLFDLGSGPLPEVKGLDDARDAKWVPFYELDTNLMFADHYLIFKDLIRGI